MRGSAFITAPHAAAIRAAGVLDIQNRETDRISGGTRHRVAEPEGEGGAWEIASETAGARRYPHWHREETLSGPGWLREAVRRSAFRLRYRSQAARLFAAWRNRVDCRPPSLKRLARERLRGLEPDERA